MKGKQLIEVAPLNMRQHFLSTPRRHGARPLLCNITADVLMTKASGLRLEIMRALSNAPLTVTEIAEAAYVNVKVASCHLGTLENLGLVSKCGRGTHRVYRISERVNAMRHGAFLQIAIATDTGDWVVVHLDESADPAQAIPPPNFFINTRR